MLVWPCGEKWRKKSWNDWEKHVKQSEAEGRVPVGYRLRRTQNEVLRKDIESKGPDRQVS